MTTARTSTQALALSLAVAAGCGGGSMVGVDAGPGFDGGTRADAGLGLDGSVTTDSGPSGCRADTECDDHVDCTADTCMVASGSCRHAITPALCAAGESCNPMSGCTPGRPCATSADCADMDACTTMETCDPAARVCTFRPLDGDGDGDPPRVCGGGDCDDSSRDVFSGADEHCNGVDDDCDTRIDEDSNGSCGDREECRGARCECAVPYMNCGGGCLDLSSDTLSCGGCGMSCSGGTCAGGACTCPAGQTSCSSGCVDLATTAADCGSCGHACGWNEGCRGSTCSSCYAAGGPCCDGSSVGGAPFCGPEESLRCIGGSCAPCGGAGQPCCLYAGGEYCPVSPDLSCTDHTCSCPAGQMSCGGSCIDTTYDPMNCGACGHACTATELCVSTACVGCGTEGTICCGGDPPCGTGLLCIDRCRRAAACDVFAQTGCRVGEGCYASYYGTYCAPAGSGTRGAACTVDTDCAAHLGCTTVGRSIVCRPYCDASDGVPGCMGGESCDASGFGSGTVGICR